jgi:selenide,water dikinase
MGAAPLFALAVVGMPIDKLPVETIRAILEGGESVCRRAGIPIAGGHSIDSVEPIYGLVAIGLVNPSHMKRNAEARPGDKLVLGKGLGVGIYSAALKKERLRDELYKAMVASTTKLNTPGTRLAALPGVHALTDVTGFGLLGHLLEVCKGSKVGATVHWNTVPLLPEVAELASEGFVTGASKRNWASYGKSVDLNDRSESERWLLCDPQTSGGLLVSCAPEALDQVLDIFWQDGFDRAAVIGEVIAGPARVSVV